MVIERLTELGLSPETIALAQGMLTGDKSEMSHQTLQMFRAAGMSHLLAVSGLHVGVIMSVVYMFLLPIERAIKLYLFHRDGYVPMRTHYIATSVLASTVIFATLLYICAIGFPISAIRAWVMLSLLLLGKMLHRTVSVWQNWAVAAFIILVWDPLAILQPGFQLSFLAVAGIILWHPVAARGERENALLAKIRGLLVVTTAAQLLTMPIVAYTFHQVPLMGWLQGLLVIPVMPVFVSMLLLGITFPGLHILVKPIEWMYHWMELVAQKTTEVETSIFGGHLYLYPTWWEALLLGVFMLCLMLLIRLHYERVRN